MSHVPSTRTGHVCDTLFYRFRVWVCTQNAKTELGSKSVQFQLGLEAYTLCDYLIMASKCNRSTA